MSTGSSSCLHVSLDELGPATEVLRAWKAEHPRCAALVLLAEAEASRLSELRAACASAGVPAFGAVFPRLIVSGHFEDSGAWLFRLDEEPYRGLLEGVSVDADEIAGQLAAALAPSLRDDEPPPTLLLLCDSTTRRLSSLLDAIYLELGTSVRYIGAAAGSETFTRIPALFDEDRFVEDGLLWLVLPTRRTGLVHDYVAVTGSSIATSVSGNRVETVAFQPALDHYRRLIRERCGVELTPESFYRFAVEYPFALELASGQLAVRMPVALEVDGAVRCSGEVPDHSLLVLAHVAQPDPARFARVLFTDPGPSPESLLFYCAGRRMRLGEASEVDLQAVLAAAPTPVAGALSLGEIGSEAELSYPLFHNGALVRIPWGVR